MTAAWLIHLLVLAALVGLAARLAEEALRVLGSPTRFVWVAALAAVNALPLFVPVGRLPAGPVADAGAAALPDHGAASGSRRADLFRAPAARLGAASVPRAVERGLALAWLAASLATAGVLLGAAVRLRRARRRWTPAVCDGVPVMVSCAAGPAVVGIVRPVIVVPAWLLAADGAVRRLVLAHEAEHVRARDPGLLAIGCTLVCGLAWNPIVWWLLRRLRLAVEIDCDRRVLRGGADRRSYGAMLLGIASRARTLPVAAVALAEPTTLLEGRIRAMTRRPPRLRRLRAVVLAGCALALFGFACSMDAPVAPESVSADAQDPPAAAALSDTALASLPPAGPVIRLRGAPDALADAGIGSGVAPLVYIDDVQVGRAALDELRPDAIERIRS